jgi:hypothetical protein
VSGQDADDQRERAEDREGEKRRDRRQARADRQLVEDVRDARARLPRKRGDFMP